MPHKLKLSNYTTTIETESILYKWNDTDMDKGAFIAAQMIKKDIREFTANGYPDIHRPDLQYFETYINGTVNERQVFGVDIKSAYASVLFLDGFISERTYNFLQTLPKKARLAAVGMLASRKDVFSYVGSELVSHDKEINPHENYFWYCVKRTSEMMNEIKQSFLPLFYWVDGIYFNSIEGAIKAREILTQNGFKYSNKNCLFFQAKTVKNKKHDFINLISFYEAPEGMEYINASKKDTEFKSFSIPVRRALRNELLNYLRDKEKKEYAIQQKQLIKGNEPQKTDAHAKSAVQENSEYEYIPAPF